MRYSGQPGIWNYGESQGLPVDDPVYENQPLYTHPAPATADKLKVAKEALEPFALLAPSEVSAGVNMGDPLSKWFTIAQLVAADQALAALNEQPQ